MILEVKISLDKENEAEYAYCSILNGFLSSYNILSNISEDLLKVNSECCDCGDKIEYRISFDKDISLDDLKKSLELISEDRNYV